MNIQQAVDFPRFHHQWMPDRVSLERNFPEATAEALGAMGHVLSERRGIQGDAHSIYITPEGIRVAVADPRRNGSAKAY